MEGPSQLPSLVLCTGTISILLFQPLPHASSLSAVISGMPVTAVERVGMLERDQLRLKVANPL